MHINSFILPHHAYHYLPLNRRRKKVNNWPKVTQIGSTRFEIETEFVWLLAYFLLAIAYALHSELNERNYWQLCM